MNAEGPAVNKHHIIDSSLGALHLQWSIPERCHTQPQVRNFQDFYTSTTYLTTTTQYWCTTLPLVACEPCLRLFAVASTSRDPDREPLISLGSHINNLLTVVDLLLVCNSGSRPIRNPKVWMCLLSDPSRYL